MKKIFYFLYCILKFVLDDIKHKIDQLQQEIEELKERKKLQDMEIANIENISLRERFLNISNNLLTEQLEKEQQVYYVNFYKLYYTISTSPKKPIIYYSYLISDNCLNFFKEFKNFKVT